MSQHSSDRLMIRDVPYDLWFFEAGVSAAAILALIFTPIPWFIPAVMLLGSVLGFVFTSTLTVSGKKQTGLLKLAYQSPARTTVKDLPMDGIASVRVTVSGYASRQQHTTGIMLYRSRHRGTPLYSVVADMKDGTVVSFRNSGSSKFQPKLQMAEAVCAFLGLPAPSPDRPEPELLQTGGLLPQANVFHQESMTGPAILHETEGVHWHMKTALNSNMAVSRWTSPDYRTPGGFLYLLQKVPSPGGSGAFSSFARQMVQASMSMYGITVAETPGIEGAQPLLLEVEDLETHFTSLASAPGARQLLTSPVAQALHGWAERYPLRNFQSGTYPQLAVLFGPDGVSLSMVKKLEPRHVEELTALGISLVKELRERAPMEG